MTPTPLSHVDLDWCFAPHHAALGQHFVSAAAALADDHDALRVARKMGADFDLYAPLLPTSEARFDVRALCLLREALGYYSPLGDAVLAVHGLGLCALRLGGSREQRQELASGARNGEPLFAFALTEPEAGSDVAAMRTTATRDGDAWILDGEKTLISNVGIADRYVVFANADPAAGKKGISAFVVPRDARGLEGTALPMSVDHPIGRLRLTQCRVPASALLGDVGQGLRIALGTLDTFRVSVGAAAVGMARRALDESVLRVKTRHQFGQPLAAQQLVQAQLAEMATELDAARLLVLRAAYEKDRGQDKNPRSVAMAKLYATEAAQRIIDRAVQLHGGFGVTRDSVVERLYREIRPLRIYEGTTEIQQLIIGKGLVA